MRRRRGLITLLTALVLGLAAAAALAVRASQQVTQQRDILISGLLINESQRLGGANLAVSRLLSVAAWRINPSSAARYAMLAAAARPGIIAVLTGPAGTVTSVAFSPDGKTLAAGRADQTVRLWDVAYLGNVVPHLCASAGRSLTPAEWAQYVPVLAYQKVCP